VGAEVGLNDFRISSVQSLKTPKILRQRGIKVIHAGFSELKPDKRILDQRLDNWRAQWQRKADLNRAGFEREVAQIIAHARAEKQREMILQLNKILRNSTFSEEALTLRVLQALEDIAADPDARRFLPRDTINMLRSLRLWLLPDDSVHPGLLEGKFTSPEDG
jgi:hypothetical protein